VVADVTSNRRSVPEFDRLRRCPKCGGDATVEYRQWREWPFGISTYLNRIVRRCERCSHAWYELPLDYDEDAELEILRAQSERAKA